MRRPAFTLHDRTDEFQFHTRDGKPFLQRDAAHILKQLGAALKARIALGSGSVVITLASRRP